MKNQITRRFLYRDVAILLTGFIIIGFATKAVAQTSNPSPLNPTATTPGTAKPVNEIPNMQQPAQNRTADQHKGKKGGKKRPSTRPNIYQQGPSMGSPAPDEKKPEQKSD